jgi:diguanylate cyclase (GGDEF)-like protein
MNLRLAFSLVLGITSFLGAFAAVFAFARRRVPASREFAAFLLACVLYAVGYIGELWAGNLPAILAWIDVEYLGIAFIPSLWLIFVLRYTGRNPPRAFAAILLGFSILTLLLVLTQRFHGLYYVNPRLDLSGSFPTLAFERGIWYWVQAISSWLSIVLGMGLLFAFFFRSPSYFRPQIAIAIFTASLPLVANLVYLLGLVPDHLDPTPITLPFLALPVGLALFRFHFLDLVPVARQRVVDALDDGVVVVDVDARLVDANPAASRIFGISHGMIGMSLDEASVTSRGLSVLATSEVRCLDFSIPVADGSEMSYHARAFPLKGLHDRRIGTAILVTDVTETARLVARLDELASTDPLTGLTNRRRFFEEAERGFALARRSGQLFVVCIADLDHFKDVNDRYGHAAGDAVLKAVADCFRFCLRASDLICRYGGEEFAIVFPGSGLEESGLALERLREKLAALVIEVAGLPGPGSDAGVAQGIRITASFGLAASVPAAEDSLEVCFERADEALYRAKNSGRNKVCRF